MVSKHSANDTWNSSARVYGTGDVSIVTNCHYFEDRLRSFELIAEAFKLSKKPVITEKTEINN